MSKKAGKTPKRKAKAAPTPSQLKETVISRSSQPTVRQTSNSPRTLIVDSSKRSPRPGRKAPELIPLVSAFETPSLRSIGGRTGRVRTAPSIDLTFRTSQEPRWLALPFNRFKLLMLSLIIVGGGAYLVLSGPVSQYYSRTAQYMESWFDWRNWVQHVTHQKNQAPYDDQSTGDLLPSRELAPFAQEPANAPSAPESREVPAPHALDGVSAAAAPTAAAAATAAATAAAVTTKAAVEKSGAKASPTSKVAKVSTKKATVKPKPKAKAKAKSPGSQAKAKKSNR